MLTTFLGGLTRAKEQKTSSERGVSKHILWIEGDEVLCQHELPRDER